MPLKPKVRGMNLVDNHSHILLADIVDMIRSAMAKGLQEYSITEHVSQFRELRQSIKFGSVHLTGRIFDSLEDYSDEFEKPDVQSAGLKVKMGLEVDFSPRYETRVGDFVKGADWDVLLCSVHELEDGREIEMYREAVHRDTAHKRWREYLDLERRALESDFVPFRILAHPVRMARATDDAPPDLDDALLELAKTARRKNRALELNGNDIDYSLQMVRSLANACSKAGCMVSFGSDAHYPKDVFKNMKVAMTLAQEFNLKPI